MPALFLFTSFLLERLKKRESKKEGVETMVKAKVGIAVGSVFGIFILVYGTALLYRLLFGGYILEGGLANINYGALAILCAIPFGWLSLIGKGKYPKNYSLILSASLFSVLFVLVHLVLVLSSGAMANDAVARTLIVFPASALLLAVVLLFTERNEKIT